MSARRMRSIRSAIVVAVSRDPCLFTSAPCRDDGSGIEKSEVQRAERRLVQRRAWDAPPHDCWLHGPRTDASARSALQL